MATYEEIRTLFNDSGLRNRIATAITVTAQAIVVDVAATANQKLWAAKAFTNPDMEAKRVMMSVLAANKDATIIVIKGATDGQIQTNVDAAVALFIDADAGV